MKLNRLLFVLLPTIIAGGCTVGPTYHRPEVSTPAHWGEPMAGGETDRAISIADWWSNFHDAELDSLEIGRAHV